VPVAPPLTVKEIDVFALPNGVRLDAPVRDAVPPPLDPVPLPVNEIAIVSLVVWAVAAGIKTVSRARSKTIGEEASQDSKTIPPCPNFNMPGYRTCAGEAVRMEVRKPYHAMPKTTIMASSDVVPYQARKSHVNMKFASRSVTRMVVIIASKP
jgi:hypothetical protein